MTPALDGAVELLERSLAYTGAALRGVDESPHGNLDAPTPCDRWRLRHLLAHMDDALDAFTEAAAGLVVVRDRTASALPATGATLGTAYPAGALGAAGAAGAVGAVGAVAPLRAKACALLAAWLEAPAGGVGGGVGGVDVGGARLHGPVLVATAALEITVHGWDVTRATGIEQRLPPDLAAGLLAVARGVLRPADRVGRFAAPVPVPGGAAPEELLLAYLGRAGEPRDGHPGSFPPAGRRGTRAAS